MRGIRESHGGAVRGWSPVRAGLKTLALAVALVLPLLVTTTVAQAPTYSVIFSFNGTSQGSAPIAGLIRDGAGNFYGTTLFGGSSLCDGFGCGVVFKLDPSGNETVLHAFVGGADGSRPAGALIRDALGNLYGATEAGGTGSCNVDQQFPGCGVVFKVDPLGNETVLYTFMGGSDGASSEAGLIRDPAGNLYGTTAGGGDLSGVCAPYGCGVVFKLNPAGKESVLHTFTSGSDGAGPAGGLILDTDGNFYGTTIAGGGGGCCGIVFKLDRAGHETILHTFTGSDGDAPYFGYLVRDVAGNLYGTTLGGGAYGHGTVFKVDAAVTRPSSTTSPEDQMGRAPTQAWYEMPLVTCTALLWKVGPMAPERFSRLAQPER